VAAYHVVWECVVAVAVVRCASYDAHLATGPQHIPTQHDMLPQHLVRKYELNCEYNFSKEQSTLMMI